MDNTQAMALLRDWLKESNPSGGNVFLARVKPVDTPQDGPAVEIEILDSYHQGVTLYITDTQASGHYTGG